MDFVLFSITVAAAFFVSSLVLLNFGRQLGLRYLRQEGGSLAGLTTVEGAVFALIGLLLAFTISGGLQRFDDRRQLVIQEANAATAASDRIGLFEGDVARNLQSKLREYVRARIELYRMPHDFSLLRQSELFSTEQQDKIIELKKNLWNAASEKHPPQVIYAMLFGLGLGGSLLAGFGMAAAKMRSWIHMVVFAATLTVTLYAVTDMEYPRLGLIRIENFDHFLIDAYKQMPSLRE
jgi:hypothetical protein